MATWRWARTGAGIALGALIAVGAVMGCGNGGGSRGGADTATPGAVEVTYYYLPG